MLKNNAHGGESSLAVVRKTAAVSVCSQSSDDSIKLKFGNFGYSGSKKALWGVAGLFLTGVAAKVVYDCLKENNSTSNKILSNHEKSVDRITEHHEASKDRMSEDDKRTDNKIRVMEARANIRREERAERVSGLPKVMTSAVPQVSLGSSIRAIHNKVGHMPDCSSIPFLDTIIEGCPEGYKDTMLLSLLSALGALSFSKVRAPYLDGRNHSPSLQTIIEGAHGSGKGKVQQMYETLFKRIIESDDAKLKLGEEERPIIQTAGINITAAKYFEIVAANKGVHHFAMETEIQTVTDRFKKKGGLSPEYLRKALYNESIYQNSKTSGAATGSFPVYFNYVFTGTPSAVAKLITPNEVEGGTAARICFSAIPETGKNIPSLTLPKDDELEAMRDQIDAWRKSYCFHSISGSDIPCDETMIDLSYINDALEAWLGKQYDLAQGEVCNTRNAERARMATIAFHAAIVLHMLAGNPGEDNRQTRRTVKKLTIYIANICMERYLQKFSSFGAKEETRSVDDGSCEEANTPALRKHITEEDVEYWYQQRGTIDENGNTIGLGKIAKKLGTDKDTVRNAFKRYERALSCKTA